MRWTRWMAVGAVVAAGATGVVIAGGGDEVEADADSGRASFAGALASEGMSTATATKTIASIVDGSARSDAPGGRLTSTNPAQLDDTVAEILLGDLVSIDLAIADGTDPVAIPALDRVKASLAR